MTSERRRIGGTFALVTGVLLVLLVFRPVATERLLAGYVIALAAIALAALTRLARPRSAQDDPSPFERSSARKPDAARSPELAYMERELVLGEGSAGYAHTRLLPLLRECAAAQLSRKHAVDLARQPGRARELLGPDVWEMLRPDRPPPDDRHAPGLRPAAVEQVVARLEEL